MGFFLTILYLVTYYLTPETVFGPLAAYRVELILAVLVALISLPALTRSFLFKTPQTLALIGLAIAVPLSIFSALRWMGGAEQKFLLFIPNVFAFFLVCLHCNSKKKLQVLVFMLLCVGLFVIAHGSAAQARGFSPSEIMRPGFTGDPYLLAMQNDAGLWIYRLCGLGEIHDPNDFGQFLVCTIPLMFIFWRRKQTARNIAFVLLPVGVLIYGVFLTHSRGALLALMAIAILALRRRIGTIPALAMGAGFFAAAMALHFTGGRDISAQSGSDRTDLWGESLQLLKSHPLFGVGFDQLPQFLGHTAHNSVAVCAAELGTFGLYFWSLFLFPTLRDVLEIASPARVSEATRNDAPQRPLLGMQKNVKEIDKAEINHLGQVLFLSLSGFLVAGWFLSRAFVATLFLLGGMSEVVYQMALDRGMIAPRQRGALVMRNAGFLAIALILIIYVLLRTVNMTR